MKKTVILISITLLMFSGCEQINALLGKKGGEKKAQMMPPQMVQIQVAKKQDVPLSFEYPATIISDDDIKIRSKVGGTVLKKYFKAGQMVKKGQKLYKIDPAVYKALYDVQVANVSVAKANLSSAQKDYNRVKKLYSKRATSQLNYDNAEAAFEVAKASLAQANASRINAKLNYDYTDVTAPFSGVVGDALVDVGDYISANTQMVRLTQTDPVYAEFYIPDVEQFNINANIKNNLWSKTDSNATIKYSNAKFKGKVTFIDKVVNATSGSVLAKAEFKDTKNALPVGSFAKITLDGFVQKSAFKVPSIALQQNLATTFLYVVRPMPKEALEKIKEAVKDLPPQKRAVMTPNGIVSMVPIKIDYDGGDYALISGGLKEGDKIIMNGFKKIYPNAQINVIGIYGQAPKGAPSSAKAPNKMEKK